MNMQEMTQAQFAAEIFKKSVKDLTLIEWQLRHIRKDKSLSPYMEYGLAHELVVSELKARRNLNSMIFNYGLMSESDTGCSVHFDPYYGMSFYVEGTCFLELIENKDGQIITKYANIIAKESEKAYCVLVERARRYNN